MPLTPEREEQTKPDGPPEVGLSTPNEELSGAPNVVDSN